MSDVSFFVTFTYEDEYLTFADDEACLCKRDFQLFLKKLRKRLEPRSLKYYCVGEYGEQWRPITPKGRPHYHALMFYRGKLDRFKLMLLIKDLWYFGIAQVCPILGAQGYVTKYILKFDKREHIVPPFSLISRGLGIDYLTPEMVAFHRSNLQSFAIKPGGYKISLPRYYKDKIFNEYQRLLIKKRSDEFRKIEQCKFLDRVDINAEFGINLFAIMKYQYDHKVYRSLELYRQKKKL